MAVWSIYVSIVFFFMQVAMSSACSNGPVINLSDIPMRLPSESSDYWSGGSDPVLSDDNLETQWYSVVYNGKQYLMVDSNNKPDHQDCSTYYPVYLQGTHPMVESLTETAQSFVACRRDYFYPCSVSYEIKIRRCGSEVQYYLSPTQSFNAFCFQVAETIFPSTGVMTTAVNQTSNIVLPDYTTHLSTTRMLSEKSTPASQVTQKPTMSIDYERTTNTRFMEHTSQSSHSWNKHTLTTGYTTSIPTPANPQDEAETKFPSTGVMTTTVNQTTKQSTISVDYEATTSTSSMEHTSESSSNKHTFTKTTPVTTQDKTVSAALDSSTKFHHVTSVGFDKTTTGANHKTTMAQSGLSREEAFDGATSKIIVILTVCIGLLIITVIGLVAVIVRRRRNGHAKQDDECTTQATEIEGNTTKAVETGVEDDHNYETLHIYETLSRWGGVANPYESLKGDKIFTMNQPVYDTPTQFGHYQTLDRNSIQTRDEHFYQTLP